MRIIYLVNARLPTEKAHGYQITKMCEALSRYATKLELWHSDRWQRDHSLSETTLFDYYDVAPVFDVKKLRNWDVLKAEPWVPRRIFKVAFVVHSILWGKYAASRARLASPDIVYTRDPFIAFWLVRGRVPTILEIHSKPRKLNALLLRQIGSSPELRRIVAITWRLREDLIDLGISSDKITVLADAVDPAMFNKIDDQRSCRERLNLPADQPIVGYVGRFQTVGMEKGIRELIEAIPLVKTRDGRKPLLVCVGGPMEPVSGYREVAAKAGLSQARLRFVDRVSIREVPAWIRTFDVAVMPFPDLPHYRHYMSPLKVFEYMASGVPIVATDLPSVREVLTHGENCWLVEPGDPRALAEGISHVLNDRSLAGAISAQARVDSKPHSWAARAGNALNLSDSQRPSTPGDVRTGKSS